MAEIPAAKVVEVKIEAPAPEDDPTNGTSPASGTAPASAAVRREAEGVTAALEQLGYSSKEAWKRTRAAIDLLSNLGRPPTGNEILSTAIRGRRAASAPSENSARAENPGQAQGGGEGGPAGEPSPGGA